MIERLIVIGFVALWMLGLALYALARCRRRSLTRFLERVAGAFHARTGERR